MLIKLTVKFYSSSKLKVQQLAHRPNLSTKALYNCIIFLNQLKLVKDEEGTKSPANASLPASLIKTYFQLFEVAVKKGASSGNKKGKKYAETDLAMKSRLLGALLTGVNRAHPYLPENDIGMEEHIDALYRISHISPPSVSTQALMLLFHLAVGSKNDTTFVEREQSQDSSRKDRFYRALYSKIADPNMLFGRQLTLFFNLVYKGMKNDTNSLRVVAFGKRLLHMAFHYSPSIVSGALFLLSEVMKQQPALKKCVFSTDGNQISFDPLKREPSSAFFRSQCFHDATEKEINNSVEEARDELVTTSANLWEISLTLHHYHPSVNKFSSSLNEIVYSGDPLRDFSLVQFLDKFAFRNPKSSKKIGNKLMRGESIGERRSGLEGNHDALSSLPMNDPSLLKKNSNISEREEFFHTFFSERAKRDEIKGIVRGKTDEEDIDPLDFSESAAVDYELDDTDDEEEAFVQGLAESLMRGAAGEGGKVDYDDEDPDMDDWSDADDSIIDTNNSDSDEFAKDANNNEFNGDGDIEKNSDEEDESILDNGLQIMFENEDEEETFTQAESDDELDDQKQKKDREVSSSFADASNYEVLIENALSKESGKKRSTTSVTEDDASESDSRPKKKRKNKKRRRKSKLQNEQGNN